MSRRQRRITTGEQKEVALRQVQASGRSVYQVAPDPDLGGKARPDRALVIEIEVLS